MQKCVVNLRSKHSAPRLLQRPLRSAPTDTKMFGDLTDRTAARMKLGDLIQGEDNMPSILREGLPGHSLFKQRDHLRSEDDML